MLSISFSVIVSSVLLAVIQSMVVFWGVFKMGKILEKRILKGNQIQ